jgi:hypothetical protein
MDHSTRRLHDFFHALSQRTFAELGMPDDEVVAYVASLLTEFATASRVHRPQTNGTDTIGAVVAMLMQRQQDAADPKTIVGTRELRKYVGDYTLFMSGLFRAHVERTGELDFYLIEGRRSYWAVSELDLSLTRTGFLFFQQMSRNFEYYSGALDYMRKAYFAHAPGASPFAEFARQVRGWIASGLSDN